MTLYARIENGNIVNFPYNLEDLRKDFPKTSFPKEINFTIASKFGVVAVEQTAPDYDDLTEKVLKNVPTKVYYTVTEENVIDPETNKPYEGRSLEEIGKVYFTGRYQTEVAVVNLPQATAEANIRTKRDQLLNDSDWVSLRAVDQGQPIDQAWELYRQALRDITRQTGFPYGVLWPTKP